jgi:hypothetical protein
LYRYQDLLFDGFNVNMGVATAGQEEAALAGKKLYAKDWLLLNVSATIGRRSG